MPEAGTQRVGKARARVEALVHAVNEHDVAKIVALHTPDAALEAPGLAEPAKGRDAIAAVFTGMFRAFPDFQFILDELEVYSSGPDRVAAKWHAAGTMTGPMEPPGFAPTGKRASFSGACFYRFHEGLIEHHTIMYDVMGILEQLAIMPAPGSAVAKVTVGLQRAITEVGKRLPAR